MKKILIFVIIIAAVLLGVQLYTAHSVKNYIANLEQNSKEIANLKIIENNITSSLFSTDSVMIARVNDIDFKVLSNVSHVLGIVRGKGQIEVLSEPLATISKMIFKNEPFRYEVMGDELSFAVPEFSFNDDGTKVWGSKSTLNLSGDFNEAKAVFALSKLAYEKYDESIDINGLKIAFSSTDFKEQKNTKSSLKISANSVNSAFMNLFNINGQNIELNSNFNAPNAAIGAKIAKLKLGNDELDSVKINVDFLDLNESAIFEGRQDAVFSKNTKVLLKDSGFKGTGGELMANGELWLKENYTAQDFGNIADFANFSANLSATKPISKMLSNLAILAAPMEIAALSNGILVKENEGYKMSVKNSTNDIIFNENVSLKAILSSELLGLFK